MAYAATGVIRRGSRLGLPRGKGSGNGELVNVGVLWAHLLTGAVAKSIGVFPRLFSWKASAPNSRRTRTVSRCPWLHPTSRRSGKKRCGERVPWCVACTSVGARCPLSLT